MKKERCDENCMTCDEIQRSYCATQLALNNKKAIESIKQMLSERVETGGESLIDINGVEASEDEQTDIEE